MSACTHRENHCVKCKNKKKQKNKPCEISDDAKYGEKNEKNRNQKQNPKY